MAKPWIHALSSARRHGGVAEDYLPIHEILDSSKSITTDSRHRCMTHNAWFVSTILPKIFGEVATNSEGKVYSVRDIGEEHCAEDLFGCIPTGEDWLNNLKYEGWMNGEGTPPSRNRLPKQEAKSKYISFNKD